MSEFPVVSQLGYVVVGVSDLEAWRGLLGEVLGMEVSEQDGTLLGRIDDHDHRLAVQPSGEDDLVAVGWQVPGPAALEKLEKRLADRDVTVERSEELRRTRGVADLISFIAPGSIPTEVYWGPRTVVGCPPRLGRGHGGFRAGELGLGHVVLAVDDPEGAERFHTEVLGFRLSDRGSGPFAFLRCNARHHSLALGPSELVRSDSLLLHVMVEALELDDVGRAMDLLPAHGLDLAITLGRHTNDRMVSFYAHTPSGFRFECGYDGLLVDEATWSEQQYADREVWGHRRVTPTLKSEHPEAESP